MDWPIAQAGKGKTAWGCGGGGGGGSSWWGGGEGNAGGWGGGGGMLVGGVGRDLLPLASGTNHS